ncbi:MAG: DUF6753 family protein [Cyanobacteria bacterium P01_C01_bin.121]
MANTPNDLLDRACRDLTPDQRARVLDLTVRLDLDADDPMWLVIIAISQLNVLFDDLPEHLAAHEERLSQWTETNLEILTLLSRKTEKMAELAAHTHALGHTLKTLTDISVMSMHQSASSTQTCEISVNSLQNSIQEMQRTLIELKTLNTHQNQLSQQHLDTLLQSLNRRMMPLIYLFSAALLGVLLFAHFGSRELPPAPPSSQNPFENLSPNNNGIDIGTDSTSARSDSSNGARRLYPLRNPPESQAGVSSRT